MPFAEDPEYAFLDDTTDSRRTETIETPEEDAEAFEAEDITPSEPPRPGRTTSPKDESTPWYLQGSNAPEAAAQRPIDIPSLPHNPPPLLATILEYVAITAGLDDIELLDLRHLDPPPALGPKLIMIIATARSEKHLHVSADRFSRWLRREHGLKANAAGLLGRNELKIKLRRKAKRMRMMANVGGAVEEGGNLDDGIRTGWICCTLSKIEAHPEDTHMPGDDVKEFIGFRDVKPGVNVVVQMFTEEKRVETDLETLWGGVLRTHRREGRRDEESLEKLEDGIEDLDNGDAGESDGRVIEVDTASSSEERIDVGGVASTQTRRAPLTSTPSDVFPPVSNSESGKQLRRLHTVGLR